jgi:phosphate transport system permease protein
VIINFVMALLVEGFRQATDRLVTSLVISAFVIALIPLVWLLVTVLPFGAGTMFNGTFLTLDAQRRRRGRRRAPRDRRHALITGSGGVISIPGRVCMTAIYLVEYGTGPARRRASPSWST